MASGSVAVQITAMLILVLFQQKLLWEERMFGAQPEIEDTKYVENIYIKRERAL